MINAEVLELVTALQKLGATRIKTVDIEVEFPATRIVGVSVTSTEKPEKGSPRVNALDLALELGGGRGR
jgi:hypothetical protein